MHILGSYLRKEVIRSTSLVLLMLMGVQCFMEYVAQLSDIGKDHYTLGKAFLYVLTQLPADLYQFFPMAGFLGSLVGLGRLAATSQLIVMQSVGISIASVTWLVIKTACWMIVVVSLLGEWLVPALQQRGEQFKNDSLGQQIMAGGVWFKEGRTMNYIEVFESSNTIRNVYRFVLDDKNKLLVAEYAPVGIYQAGRWVLKNVSYSRFLNDRVRLATQDSVPFTLAFNATALQESEKETSQRSIFGLYKFIKYRQQVGLYVTHYIFIFWQRILQPLSTAVMIGLAVPVVFGSLRSTTMGVRVLTGIIIGFVFYMLNQFFGPFAMVYQMPAPIAAAMPTVLFGLGGSLLYGWYFYIKPR